VASRACGDKTTWFLPSSNAARRELTLHTSRIKAIYLNIFKLSSLEEAVAQFEEDVFSFETNYSDKVCVFQIAPVRGAK